MYFDQVDYNQHLSKAELETNARKIAPKDYARLIAQSPKGSQKAQKNMSRLLVTIAEEQPESLQKFIPDFIHWTAIQDVHPSLVRHAYKILDLLGPYLDACIDDVWEVSSSALKRPDSDLAVKSISLRIILTIGKQYPELQGEVDAIFHPFQFISNGSIVGPVKLWKKWRNKRQGLDEIEFL